MNEPDTSSDASAGRPDPTGTGGVPSPWSGDSAWQAFVRRDRNADGRFVVGVRSTGIYCRPSCPARRPKRDGVVFFADGAAARQAGYRACRRCRPDEARRDSVAVAQAARALAECVARGEKVTLAGLAASVGYAPHHFQRLFLRAVGVSPAAYARQLRAARLEQVLEQGGSSVTEAIYEAGYGGASGAYGEAGRRLGMTPGARRRGGAGERIRFAVVDSALGALLVAASERGLCRIAFDEDEAALRAHYPEAELVPPDAAFAAQVARVVAAVDDPARAADADLPLDVRGTAFRQAVWAALRAIPPGETRSYAELAAAAGRPQAVRAAGSACGANALAVLIPCHRAVRSDGGLGGYAYGLERKRALLEREADGADRE